MVTIYPILADEEKKVLILGAVHPNSKHLSNEEISQRLGISISRVKTVIHQACTKLGADNKNEAILLAMKCGEIKLNELISMDELAEILNSIDPSVLRMLAGLVRSDQLQNSITKLDANIACVARKENGILTNRERDVLILSRYGLTNTEMAEKLCMTTSAVRTFLNRAFKKLGARKKADAIQAALKQREISIGEISSLFDLAAFLAPLGAENIEKIARILDEKYWPEPHN